MCALFGHSSGTWVCYFVIRMEHGFVLCGTWVCCFVVGVEHGPASQ